MVDIASILSKTVIFLFDKDGDYPIGTAFIVGYPIDDMPGKVLQLVVTAKHVIGDHQKIIGRFSRKDEPGLAEVVYDIEALRTKGNFWEHKDKGVDIIVFPSHTHKSIEYSMFPLELIASKKTFEDENIKVTDRIIFPCLLINFMGARRNYPVTRDGSIACIPNEPVPLKYKVGNKSIRTNQPIILMDATSIPGASGAPIYLWPGPRLIGNVTHWDYNKVWLVGIMHGFYPASPRELIEIQTDKISYEYQENSGIAISFPSWRLLEILTQENVISSIRKILDS